MLDANLFFLWSDVMNNFTFRAEDTEEVPYADLSLFIRKTSDGYIASMPVQQSEVDGAFRALELEELIDDARFAEFESRARNRSVLKDLTDVAYARFTTAEIAARLERNDVPWSEVNLRHEVIDDPQIKAMGALLEYDHPVIGPVRQPRPAAQFARTPSNMHQPTAFLGQHNSEVLSELGYSETEIASLVAQKVLHTEMG